MHELGLIQSAVQMALDEAQHAGATHIERMTLRVGEAAGVDDDVLRMGFVVATRGTLAEGATLIVETVPVICQCRHCNHEFTPRQRSDLYFYHCPQCGQFNTRVKQGRDIELGTLELAGCACN
jgi:hydrogenase nickel incorporation protein HypA/HybF